VKDALALKAADSLADLVDQPAARDALVVR
jgi:hypothetical protein